MFCDYCIISDSLSDPVALQDAQVQQLKEQVSSLSSQNEQMQSTITQQLSQIQQHKDQYNILKLKLGRLDILAACDWTTLLAEVATLNT